MLRFTLGVLFLSQVQAQNTTKKDGETECDFNRFLNGKDTGKKIKCQWQTECSKSSNETLSGCLLKGNKVCERFQYLGSEGKVSIFIYIFHMLSSYFSFLGCSKQPTNGMSPN